MKTLPDFARHLMLGLALTAGTATLSACASPAAAGEAHASKDAHRVYSETADARADINAALARAQSSGRHVLLVFGANWCHDSRGFAEHLERPDIAALVADSYEVAYVDVGSPQTGRGRNLDLAAEFGQDKVVGTPTLVVLRPDGTRINSPENATAWRNAHSRTPEAVLAALAGYLQ